MSSSPARHKPSDPRSTERRPQVVVRAGKHYVCSACGTLVEIPADVVGKLVMAVDPAPQPEAPPEADRPEPVAAAEEVTSGVPSADDDENRGARVSDSDSHQADPAPSDNAPAPRQQSARPARPRRPKTPHDDNHSAGPLIDGLVVPTADKFDRAQAWITFHRKVLGRQGTEFHRLRKLLKAPRPSQRRESEACRVPRSSLLERAEEATPQDPVLLNRDAEKRHAQADLDVAPRPADRSQLRSGKRQPGRGPP